jgi:hypothetical protein
MPGTQRSHKGMMWLIDVRVEACVRGFDKDRNNLILVSLCLYPPGERAV